MGATPCMSNLSLPTQQKNGCSNRRDLFGLWSTVKPTGASRRMPSVFVQFGLYARWRAVRRGAVTRLRLAPGSLRYAHFEVEMGEDGFPVELGAGAMAVTYRARDTILRSVVALKVVDRQMAENPVVRGRFLREARAAAQLHHPNVARVTYYGEQENECFYVME